MSSFNDTIIADFRANAGVLGGHWEGKKVLLLHTVGPRTGKEYVYPLVAAPLGDEYLLCASMGGAPKDPQWVAALEATTGPATVEIGTETRKAATTVVRPDGPEWERLYGAWKDYWPDAAEYETKTDRKFPIVRVRVED